jgi:ubiquinone/menaquinone biosynthesis C-methylase UbiE
MLKDLIQQIDIKGKDVLEVGCGEGGFTFEHLTTAGSILGIDPKASSIEAIQREASKHLDASRAVFRVADIKTVALPDEAFDVVVFANSF